MSNRITKEEKLTILELHSQGYSVSAIAKQLGRSGNGVKGIVNPDYREAQRVKAAKHRDPVKAAELWKNYSQSEAGKAAIARRDQARSDSLDGVSLITVDGVQGFAYELVDQEKVKAVYKMAKALSTLHETAYHVDHIQPLACGGSADWWNLRIIKGDENLKKGSSFNTADQELLAKRLFGLVPMDYQLLP